MDRSALFVDAGYLLADGAMAVHGTRQRESVSWDFGGLLQLLGNLSRERTGLSLLRCYWYEATVEGHRSAEHDTLADLPGLKLRLGRIRPGRREGVDTEIHRDLMTLARNDAIADAVLVTGDEDLVQAITDVQALGVRVTIVHVSVDGNWTLSRTLRQECDDLIEIGSSHLRPYVTKLTGSETASSSNGHGSGSASAIAPLSTGPHTSPPPATPITAHPSLTQASPANMSTHSSPSPAAPMHAAPTPAHPGTGSRYTSPPTSQHGPYTGPGQLSPNSAQQQHTPTLAEAVKSAHHEGQDFGESVARDAPALWLEAVLARKPRMPSDLEARLLQGSSLPIDFLLHDEVRHALRRGFWDALERSRR